MKAFHTRRIHQLLVACCCLAFFATPSHAATSSTARPVMNMIGTMAAVGVAVTVGAILRYNKLAPIFEPLPDSLTGQTILITGANTGLGLASAQRLAASGANVILVTRSDEKGQAAVKAVMDYVQETTNSQQQTNNRVSYKVLQLDDLQNIREAVTSWKKKDNDDLPTIDVLMNNAGLISGSQVQLTKDNMEVTFQTNHLGHFLLTALLADKLSPSARIINVASDAHKFVSELDLEYAWHPTKEDYGFMKSYAHSKLANILFTQELQRRVDAANSSSRNWTVVAVHPGPVATDFFRNPFGKNLDMTAIRNGQGTFWERLFFKTIRLFLRSVEQGASTQIWLAARAEQVNNVRGQYFTDCELQTLADYAQDEETAKRLWKESEERSNIQFDLSQDMVEVEANVDEPEEGGTLDEVVE